MRSNKTHSRRDFLTNAAGGAALIGLQGVGITNSTSPRHPDDPQAGKKLKIVITGGHPGDPEYGCGGTAALYADMGHEVVFLYLNRGEGGIEGKSGNEAAAIRTAEALNACMMLKARAIFATQIDGQSIVDVHIMTSFTGFSKPNSLILSSTSGPSTTIAITELFQLSYMMHG